VSSVAGTEFPVVGAGRHGESVPSWAWRLIVWGCLLLIWHVLAVWKGPFFLPTPAETARGIVRLFTEGHGDAILTSLQQFFTGFLLAVVIGVPLGLLMGSVRLLDDLLSPYMNTLFVTSKEALLPLLIVVFGVGLRYRVSVVFLFAIFFIVMNTAAGVLSTDRALIETVRSFGLGRVATFWKVIIPATAPFVISGLRLGLGTGIKGMVIAELWVLSGIGELAYNFVIFKQLDLFFALVIVVAGIGVGGVALLGVLENRWRGGTW
jgi:ABC-type nitrate/sulfonate/bicarbonate transport system permease component